MEAKSDGKLEVNNKQITKKNGFQGSSQSARHQIQNSISTSHSSQLYVTHIYVCCSSATSSGHIQFEGSKGGNQAYERENSVYEGG